MLRCYLQATADMAGNELAGIFLRAFVSVRVLALVQQQVIAYTAANEGLLDAGQGGTYWPTGLPNRSNNP